MTTWAVLTELSHLAPSVAATLPLSRWIDKGGLELLPLGRDELVRAIDWIEKCATGRSIWPMPRWWWRR